MLAATLAACHAARPAPPEATAACADLESGAPFDSAHVRELAGEYELTMVDTVSRRGRPLLSRGWLRLWAQDSARSLRGPFGPMPAGGGRERPLAGAFRRTPPDTGAWARRLASEDPDHPGALWMFGRLRLGEYDVLDGVGDDLRVRWVSGVGFAGAWQTDLGIGIAIDRTGRAFYPGGYFCARRVDGPAPSPEAGA